MVLVVQASACASPWDVAGALNNRTTHSSPGESSRDGEQGRSQSQYSLLSLDGVGGCHIVAGDVACLSGAERVGQPPVSLSEQG